MEGMGLLVGLADNGGMLLMDLDICEDYVKMLVEFRRNGEGLVVI